MDVSEVAYPARMDELKALLQSTGGNVLFFVLLQVLGIPAFKALKRASPTRLNRAGQSLLVAASVILLSWTILVFTRDEPPLVETAASVLLLAAVAFGIRERHGQPGLLQEVEYGHAASQGVNEQLRGALWRVLIADRPPLEMRDYLYAHEVGPDGRGFCVRDFTVSAPHGRAHAVFFQTGATEDCPAAELEELGVRAVEIDSSGRESPMKWVALKDDPRTKVIAALFSSPLEVGAERHVRIEYMWPGAWLPLLRNLKDGAKIEIEGLRGQVTGVRFEIRLSQTLGLRIGELSIQPAAGRIVTSRDRLSVSWQQENLPPGVYRWELQCYRTQ